MALGLFAGGLFHGMAASVREPDFARPPSPRKPDEPGRKTLPPEGPTDVLDTHERVRAFVLATTTREATGATRVQFKRHRA